MSRISSFVVGLGLVIGACSKKAEVDTAQPASTAPAVRHVTAPMAENPRDIQALFQVESDNRPGGKLRAEDVLAGLRRGGAELSDVHQHLARPYGARYCVGAVADQCALSVCEYVDAAAAEAGADTSRHIPLAHRQVQVNGAVSLTVREMKPSPEADTLSRRLFGIFAAL